MNRKWKKGAIVTLAVGGIIGLGVLLVVANVDAGSSSQQGSVNTPCYTHCNWLGTWNCENDRKVGSGCLAPQNCIVSSALNIGSHPCENF